jgi:predicted lipoprotein with Yx(FWY)xxD motif
VHHLRLSIAAAAVAAVALAACGSSGAGSSHSSRSSRGTQPATSNITATTAQTPLGRVLVDGHGLTLYGRTLDVNGMSSCTGSCATAWPPVLVNGTALPAGLDAAMFAVVTRPDGTHQLEAGKWPLYRFAGDAKPGDTNGEGSESFFAVAPTGKLVKPNA